MTYEAAFTKLHFLIATGVNAVTIREEFAQALAYEVS
jgi:L-asparaginase